MQKPWTIVEGDSPLISTAIHNGHEIRPELKELLSVDDTTRFREEDPFTGQWTTVAETRIVHHRSRFEVDMNRSREKAIYIKPEDAWGLSVWKDTPSQQVIDDSLALYDAYYSELRDLLTKARDRFGKFVVLDLHSYCHRRGGPEAELDPPELNPEVIVGTSNMNRELWAPVVDRFITDLSQFGFGRRQLDVRENVKFRGGHQSRWIHDNFPQTGCSLAIEFKKFFMDEWTGEPYREQIDAIGEALAYIKPGILEALERVKRK